MQNVRKRTRLREISTLTGMLLLLIICSGVAAGSDPTAGEVKLDEEKRSCIQSVDGYAYLSENLTLSQTREAAMANAKRQAVAAAETTIKSKTVVKNFVLVSDVIEDKVTGAVRILEQKDFGIEDNRRYHVWIKAEVSYGYEPQSAAAPASPVNANAAALTMNSAAPLTVKVWTPRKIYRQGDVIEIYLLGNRDFYARIVDINPNGDIIQLLPNDYRRSAFFTGGRIYRIPGDKDRFSLTVTPPFGQDRVIVYASDVPLGDVPLEPAGQGLSRYRGSRRDLAIGSRGISVAATKPGTVGGAEFYEGTWILGTSP